MCLVVEYNLTSPVTCRVHGRRDRSIRMRKIRQKGVPPVEHENYHTMPDWAGARVFLEVVRNGSFRAAAAKLGIPLNTLRHRLSGFERQLGLTLVTRHVD